MSEISIIVPVYNTEKFLPRCINHLINQSFEDFEILLIDDGSTDNSPGLCRKYAESDSRIKFFSVNHTGVGAIRNIGLDNANGKYILFCDSDDYVERDWIKELHRVAREHPDSLCNCEYCCDRPLTGESEIQTLPNITKSQLILKKHFYPMLHHGKIMQIWTRIYRTDIIRKHGIRFRNDLVEGEDAVFNCDYLNYCDSFYYIHKSLYHWVNNDVKSITRSFHPYYFETLKIIYHARKQHIADEYMQDFYDYSFNTFMLCPEYAWDAENTDSEKTKMQYCIDMFKDPVFIDVVKHAGKKFVPIKSDTQ